MESESNNVPRPQLSAAVCLEDDFDTLMDHILHLPSKYLIQSRQLIDRSLQTMSIPSRNNSYYCCHAKFRSMERVVLKRVKNIDKLNLHVLLREVLVLSQVHHLPYIIEFKGIYWPQPSNMASLTCVTKCLSNGTLQELSATDSWSHFEQFHRIDIAIGIAVGLEGLHSLQFIHGAVAPENILFNEYMQPHISGFGKLCTSSHYARYKQGVRHPPEIKSGSNYTNKVDVYMFGLILRVLASKTSLNHEDTANKFIQSEQFDYLITNCIHENPHERPEIWDVVDALKMLQKLLN